MGVDPTRRRGDAAQNRGRCAPARRAARAGCDVARSRGSSFICVSTSREPHRQGLVEHDAERALVGVLADERHRLREIGIGERGHRDQEMVRKNSAAHGIEYGHAARTGSRNRGDAARLSRGRRRTATRRQSAARDIARSSSARKGIEGTGELQDVERGLVKLADRRSTGGSRPSPACRRRRSPPPAPGSVSAGAARGGRVIQRADALDLVAPGIKIGREACGARVGRHPELVALGPAQLGGSAVIVRGRPHPRVAIGGSAALARRGAAPARARAK